MESTMTMGDIFEKPKRELFLDAPNTKFYNYCREREKEIKSTIRLAIKAFDSHVRMLMVRRDELPKWKKDRMKFCLSNIGNYLEELLNELDRTKIENYCKQRQTLGKLYIPFFADMVLIMINSYHGAIETDLHWVNDLTLADSMEISSGNYDYAKLEKYLPERIKEIENLLQALRNVDYVNSRVDHIAEALKVFKSKHYRASNVLLITLIEGLVRSLGAYLKEKQGLSIDPSDKRKYASLERFLKNIPWKQDLKIDGITYGLLTGNYSLNKSDRGNAHLVNLEERLGFLCRRFKENRNLILHGEEINYANHLNNFLNLTALKEVLITIKAYYGLYGTPATS
jgi:hypothetical protein